MRRPSGPFAATLLAALAAVLASPAAADPLDPFAIQSHQWRYVCAPGALEACGHFSIGFAWDEVTDRTAITVGISNLQGADPWVPAMGRYGFYQIGISHLTTTYAGSMIGQFSLAPNGSLTDGVALDGGGDLDAMFGEMYWTTGDRLWAGLQQGGSYVWGCDGAPGGLITTWRPSTCLGTVLLSLTVNGRWATTATSDLTLWGADEFGNGFRCTTGVDCVTIASEPLGMAAVAGALMLLAFGVRGRRRVRVTRAGG
jgi:hypothetical protein